MNTTKAIIIKKEISSGESLGPTPHFSHSILHHSMRQSDSIDSAQKLDNVGNR